MVVRKTHGKKDAEAAELEKKLVRSLGELVNDEEEGDEDEDVDEK